MENNKQETLEEVAEKLTKDFPHYSVRESMDDSDIKGWFLEALQKGYNLAQQQDKKMYSDEDMIRFANGYSDININESHLQFFNNLPKFKNK